MNLIAVFNQVKLKRDLNVIMESLCTWGLTPGVVFWMNANTKACTLVVSSDITRVVDSTWVTMRLLDMFKMTHPEIIINVIDVVPLDLAESIISENSINLDSVVVNPAAISPTVDYAAQRSTLNRNYVIMKTEFHSAPV